MKKLLIVQSLAAAFAFAVTSCLGAPSPVAQVADAGKLTSCVVGDWGKPLSTIIADCGPSAEPVVVDVVADIGSLLAKQAPAVVSPYASEPKVIASLARRAGDGGVR